MWSATFPSRKMFLDVWRSKTPSVFAIASANNCSSAAISMHSCLKICMLVWLFACFRVRRTEGHEAAETDGQVAMYEYIWSALWTQSIRLVVKPRALWPKFLQHRARAAARTAHNSGVQTTCLEVVAPGSNASWIDPPLGYKVFCDYWTTFHDDLACLDAVLALLEAHLREKDSLARPVILELMSVIAR